MDYEALGRRIRAQRKLMSMTQAELAERVGVSSAFIGHIERGTRIASLETICRIADALECSIDELVGRHPGCPGLDPEICDILDRISRLRLGRNAEVYES